MNLNQPEVKKENKNWAFPRFFKCLPDYSKKDLREKLANRIQGHTTTQFYNWTGGKTAVPIYLQDVVSDVCQTVLAQHLQYILTDFNTDEYLIKIFKNQMDNNEKTTLLQEMGKAGIRTQKELAELSGVSQQIISKIMNEKAIGLSWATVKKLADYFNRDPNDFKEFTR